MYTIDMKRIGLLILLCLGLWTHPAQAFLYDISLMSKEEIKSASDAQLLQSYIDAKIELDASRTFHGKAGFTPKEYEKHKDLLNYIITLRLEMQLRELEVPPIDEWIR